MKITEEKEAIMAKVCQVLSQVMHVPIESIHENSSPDTIANWNSLHHMNLILALEEEFGVQFTDEQIVNLIRVKLIVNTLHELLGKNG